MPGWWIGEKDGRVDKPYISPESWNHKLRSAGFTGDEGFGYDAVKPFQLTFTMLSSKIRQETKTKVILVNRKEPCQWAHNIAEGLNQLGYTTAFGTLEGDPSGAGIMFLLDAQGPYLYDMPEEDFFGIQQYITKTTGPIFWLTKSSQLTCQDPRYGLIYGLARTLRREMGCDFSVFETDLWDNQAAESVCHVYDRINASHQTDELDPDYEFSYHKGMVYVGRCHWVPPVTATDELSTEGDDDMVIKLDISTPGLLDTLTWSKIPPDELGDDEVEVEVRYVGLNFRVGQLSDSTYPYLLMAWAGSYAVFGFGWG